MFGTNFCHRAFFSVRVQIVHIFSSSGFLHDLLKIITNLNGSHSLLVIGHIWWFSSWILCGWWALLHFLHCYTCCVMHLFCTTSLQLEWGNLQHLEDGHVHGHIASFLRSIWAAAALLCEAWGGLSRLVPWPLHGPTRMRLRQLDKRCPCAPFVLRS